MATLYQPYCSLDDVVQAAGNSEPEVSDIFIESIELASRRIDEICGRDFNFHNHSIDPYIVPRRRVIGNVVMLPFEINSLTEVKLDGVEIDLASLSYAEGDTFFEYSSNFGSIPFTGELAIKGTFGFTASPSIRVTGSLTSAIPREAITFPILHYEGILNGKPSYRSGNSVCYWETPGNAWVMRYDDTNPTYASWYSFQNVASPELVTSWNPGTSEQGGGTITITKSFIGSPTFIPASIRRATILTACAFSSEWRRERVAFDGSRESLLETKVPSEVNELVKPWIQRGRAVGF
jgi:hypothetical protein